MNDNYDRLFHLIPCVFTFLWRLCVVWNVIIGRSSSLWLPVWRVLQLVQHGLNEGLQQRYQSVSWGQAARWRCMDEGCSPLSMIQWAVIGKITQVPQEEDRKLYLIYLSVLKQSWQVDACSCNRRLPASISGIKDVHPCLFKLFGDSPHVNDRVQFLWSSFHTAVTLRTEATHIFVNVSTVLPCLL